MQVMYIVCTYSNAADAVISGLNRRRFSAWTIPAPICGKARRPIQ